MRAVVFSSNRLSMRASNMHSHCEPRLKRGCSMGANHAQKLSADEFGSKDAPRYRSQLRRPCRNSKFLFKEEIDSRPSLRHWRLLPLHLHDLIHRHHVVVEVRHDPERSTERSTISTPNASASTLLVLSGPVVMCRKITAPPPGRYVASGQVGSHCHGPLLPPCEVANPARNHLNFGIAGTLMRGGGGAATLAALPTPLGSTITLFIPPAFAGPGAIPLMGTFPAAAEPALRANWA